jgi:hypothetical protein
VYEKFDAFWEKLDFEHRWMEMPELLD